MIYAQDKSRTSTQQTILRDFLDAQRPSSADEPCLPNLLQTWSFAAQTNNDSLLSSVSSIFALLLKTISSLIDLRAHGLLLGRTLLQQTQLKLIARGLSAPRPKEHLIAPCLRLLTEIVSFDGGVLAKQVYSVRSFTLDPKILSRNLSFTKPISEDPEETRRRPAVRTVAVRYLIANLKFQSSPVKTELLKYSNVFRALFEHVKQDPAEVLHDLLAAFKTHVSQDPGLSRQSKSFVLHEGNLSNIATLYRHDQPPSNVHQDQRPDQLAHAFLSYVCTEPAAGLLRASSWYPPGAERSNEEQQQATNQASIDLGLDSIEWFDKFHNKVPVRNGTLAKFSHGLRPYANILESELLIEIFKAAPELVANFFIEKSTFAFDPKLTATWIGYSAFLYSATQLPVPSKIGPGTEHGRFPPPISIMLENTIPRALTQQVLTRCLNQKIELITFFTIRLLALSLQKLQAILKRLGEAAKEGGSLWHDASTRLVNSFSARCPTMKDIIAAWKSTPPENTLQQEAMLRLLRLRYQVTPQSALQEKFDVSAALNNALTQFHEAPADFPSSPDDARLKLLVLNHLLQISHYTPDMRWFSKPASGALSPCGSLVKILVTASHSTASVEMRALLESIVKDNNLLQLDTRPSGLDAFLSSFVGIENKTAADTIFEFVDDIFDRLSKRPIKYEDDLKQITNELYDAHSKPIGPNSLIWATVLEQLPFVLSRDVSIVSETVKWLGRFSTAGRLVGEDVKLQKYYLSQLHSQAQDQVGKLSVDAFTMEKIKGRLLDGTNPKTPRTPAPKSTSSITTASTLSTQVSLAPPREDDLHHGLHLWTTYPDIPTAISSNTLPPLIQCLSSAYTEVSSQALTNIRTIMTRIQPLLPSVNESTTDPLTGTSTPNLLPKLNAFPDATPIYLLLGILSNTSARYLSKQKPPSRVPGIATEYAAAAAKVLLDPLHPVYDKVNAFHTRAPKWDVSRIASHWITKILLEAPSEDLSVSLTSSSSRSFGTGGKSNMDSSTTEDGMAAVRAEQDDPAATPYAAASHNEIHFLLCVILNSLTTPEDVEILRARGSFEPLLALLAAGNTHVLPTGLRKLVLKILWRVVLIEGGATTLITRCGLLTLLGGLLAVTQTEPSRENDSGLLTKPGLRALAKSAWEKCDQSRVLEWSDGVEQTMRDLIGE